MSNLVRNHHKMHVGIGMNSFEQEIREIEALNEVVDSMVEKARIRSLAQMYKPFMDEYFGGSND